VLAGIEEGHVGRLVVFEDLGRDDDRRLVS
jgi:hypothetical protein